MNTLLIADTFDPYYADRLPFSCPRWSDSPAPAEDKSYKDRIGNETISVKAGAGRRRAIPPRPPGR